MINSLGIELIPKNDERRVKALRRYNILDTPPEGAFNNLAELAMAMFNVPLACITFVDKERVFYKSGNCDETGNNISVERTGSCCSLAILNNDISIIEHFENDPCLIRNADMLNKSSAKFYAGAPLRTFDGYNIGMFVIFDHHHRDFSAEQFRLLKQFAQIVMEELELRYSGRNTIQLQNQLLKISTHELKSPLNRITNLTLLLRQEKKESSIKHIINLIEEASRNLVKVIDTISETNDLELKKLYLELSEVNMNELLEEVIGENKLQLKNKNLQIQTNIQPDLHLMGDRDRLKEIVDTLLNNAMKHSFAYGKIELKAYLKKEHLCLEIRDFGQGFKKEDLKEVFIKFSCFNRKPTGGELETGLELPLVKNLMDLHGGKINIESKGENEGTIAQLEFPLEVLTTVN